MKKFCNTEAELEKRVAYIKKRISPQLTKKVQELVYNKQNHMKLRYFKLLVKATVISFTKIY